MSGAFNILQMKEDDVFKSFVAETLLGGTNVDFQMERYIYESAGIYIPKLKRTWEKLLLVAHAVVAVENPADVSIISSWSSGKQAMLQFVLSQTPITGPFIPGMLLTRSRQLFWSSDFWSLLIPGLVTNLSQGVLCRPANHRSVLRRLFSVPWGH